MLFYTNFFNRTLLKMILAIVMKFSGDSFITDKGRLCLNRDMNYNLFFQVEYFASPRCWVVDSVFSGDGKVLAPYGGFALENGDADGGWIATATDLVRFMCALDGSGPTRYTT